MMVQGRKLPGMDGPVSSIRRPETLANQAEHIATSKMLITKDKSTSASEKGDGREGCVQPKHSNQKRPELAFRPIYARKPRVPEDDSETISA